MPILIFDGRMGASGDMILGSLLDAGADPAALKPVEQALSLRYEHEAVRTNGIGATSVSITRAESDTTVTDEAAEHANSQEAHEHSEDHVHTHNSAEHTGPHRSYPEVQTLLDEMQVTESTRHAAQAVFQILGEAESTIHQTNLKSTQFHEVGADDAIADIVGTVLLIEDLDVEGVYTTPVAVGGGQKEMTHGTYPIPAPAVIEIAQSADWSLTGGPVSAELLTPTGAALLAYFAQGTDTIPPMHLNASGYGAGDAVFESHPNALRALIGEPTGRLERESITVLETNVDDVSPELLGSLHESLQSVGARDVSIIPTTMKKSRPGHLIKVVVKPADAAQVADRLARETGTLGIREHRVAHRWRAQRAIESVSIQMNETSYDVPVKIARNSRGTVLHLSAEFDAAQAVASATERPVKEVMNHAEDVARDTVTSEQ
ncbi:MAG: TIGR00299 family protein [Haloquadratum sp. J07HQX50]|nr:MAG: TIGR00299 family protein [Haloquadratum sp. J07HQX50]